MASVGEVSAQVRRIAVLVTSLDATAGRQLLMAMPSQLSRDVRKAMAGLTNIDPEEQRRVLADFRNQAIGSAPSERVSSPPSRASQQQHSASLPSHSSGSHAPSSLTQPTHHTAFAPETFPTTQAHSAQHRRGQPHPSWASHSAASESISSHPSEQPQHGFGPYSTTGQSSSAADLDRPWQRFDTATLSHWLRGERGTVIAVVLSQLEAQQAVTLLEQLPREQQREVLGNLSRLGQIDPEAMQAIDEHLASRIDHYHHRRSGDMESIGRMQELLAAASPELRSQWHTVIHETDQQLAMHLGLVAEPASTTQSAGRTKSAGTPHSAAQPQSVGAIAPPNIAAASRSTRDRVINEVTTAADDAAVQSSSANNLFELLGSNVVTTVDSQFAYSALADIEDEPRVLPFPTAAGLRSNTGGSEIHRLEQILELPSVSIAQVISAVDGEVLLLALAGAAPSFMQRFTNMLDKQDARALQLRLRRLTSINLQDIDEAQRRLCELATEVLAQSQAGQLGTHLANQAAA